MRVKRFATVVLALAVLFVGVVPTAAVAAEDGEEIDCQYHVPEDPDCDGKMEQPGPDDYDDPGEPDSGGLIDALFDVIGLFF